jgi:hypothetical protein
MKYSVIFHAWAAEPNVDRLAHRVRTINLLEQIYEQRAINELSRA